jgi:hypothetical protein
MDTGKIYRCKNGSIMGTIPLGQSAPSFNVILKAFNSEFANEQANDDIDNQINDCLN